MEQNFVIAYDLGTSGVKVALVSMEGAVLATATDSYPLYTPRPNWAEQDPELYWQSVCRVTKEVFAASGLDPAGAAGLAFSTQWKGIIPIDCDGHVLHNSMIWLDARAESQAARMNAHFGAGKFSAADYWPKLMWLRENEPKIVDDAVMILEANSFLKWKATGEAAIDISNCFLRSFDPKLESLYEQILDFAGIPQEKFPRWVAFHERVGSITAAAAEEMGLVPGIPVFGGSSDIPAIAIGSGCSDVGGVHMYFGSSGWVGYSQTHTADELYISPFDQQRDIALFGLQAVGLSLNWAVDKLYAAEKQQLGDGVYDLMNREVAEIPAGCEGALATPWFCGERPPLFGSDARGNFLNLGPRHDRRHMTRAVMEGVCYALRMATTYNHEAKGYPMPKSVSVVGGGSGSDVWMQALADVLEIPVHVPRAPRHAGAVGTAYCVLLGLGVCQDYSDVARKIQIERSFYPQPENAAVYRRGYSVFKQLYGILKPMFSAMNSAEN